MEIRDDTPGIFIPFEEVPDFQGFENVDLQTSKIGEKLGLQNIISNDFETEVKARAIDRFLRDNIKSDSMKDSVKFFENSLEKLASRLGLNIITELQKGNGLSLLDKMFRGVAISKRLSSESFAKGIREEYKQYKIKSLLNQLKQLK